MARWTGDLVLAEHDGERVGPFRVRRLHDRPAAFEHRHIEEAQGGQSHGDAGGLQLLHAEEVNLVIADVVEAELVGGAVEMSSELLDCEQVRFSGSLSIITTLEFIEHHFA